jgi:preprotein translocase subunit SecG
MLSLASTLLYIVFVLAAIVLVVVVLLQEGRGGGLTDALGTSGQQTFGVGASGINRFTGITAAVFLGSALLIHFVNRQTPTVFGDDAPIPAESSPFPGGGDGSGGAPGGSSGAPPGAPPSAPAGGTSGGQPPAGPPPPPNEGGEPK